MMIKYRVHEVAKDFDVPSKDIISLLAKYFPDAKKSQTALEENELNLVFDALTQENQVDSFDRYFEIGAQAQAEAKKKAAEEKAEREKEQARIAAELRAAQKAMKEQEAEEKKNANKVPSSQQHAAGEKVAVAPKKKKNPSEQPNRGPAELRHVDTRANEIRLDRYDEKYDNIAQERGVNYASSARQHIKKKTQQQRGGFKKTKHETEEDKMRRIQLERIKKMPLVVSIGDSITIGDLSQRLKKPAAEIIKQLMLLGIMANITQEIDFETAELVATELGAKVEREITVTIEEKIIDDTEDNEENMVSRDPVVVVMGHVDHGKTSILDAIRHQNVVDTEAGGITQAIGAYRTNINGRDITFLDTPGHAAFTAMRERGAKATDIAILVVAADDGIMPQTVEAINHARAAKVQIIVAINKMDKVGANPDRVLQQLTEYELVPEEWGGDVICVPVSAKTGQGLDKLLESVILVADVLDLKANPNRRAGGTVIEAKLDKGRGPVATLLVQKGTLRPGDIVVAGTSVGRVRMMNNENGVALKEAGPSIPVEITGLDEAPNAGDTFDAVSDERLARELVEQRKHAAKEEIWNSEKKVTLENLFSQMQEGDIKDLSVIVKADVQGSVEAVKQSLEKLSNEEVRVRVIHGAVGGVNESDVMLANTSNAIIVGFNVRPDTGAKEMAERDGVEMRMYRVIYNCIEDIEAAMKGMLAPKFRDVEQGSAEVRQVYKISNVGTVAGTYITNGRITRSSKIRVVRDGIVVAEDEIKSLKRFKDDAKEVAQGFECGITLEKFNDIKEGDILEAYTVEEYRED